MNCPRCGATSGVVETRVMTSLTTRRRRECVNGHRFTTIEIPSQAYGSARQRLAVFARTTAQRIALWKRDKAIAAELHHGWQALAHRYGLTKTAIYTAAQRGRDAGGASAKR